MSFIVNRLSRRVSLASVILAMALGTTALACPVCDTGTGREVRDGLFDESFVRNVFAVVLPFPILLGVVAMIHFGWPGRRAGNQPMQDSTPTDAP